MKSVAKPVTTLFLNMVVEPQVRKFCGPLFFVLSTTTPKGTIKGSASFGLVDTGQKKLLVTCWHVLFAGGGFRELHSVNPALQFGIGFGGIRPVSIRYEDLMEKKVDDERRCDLVTFDVSDALDLVANSNLEFYNLKVNRPPNVEVGDIVYLIGFPSKDRIENETSVGHICQPIGAEVSRVNESNFMASVTNLKLDATDYGGISGAPCFVVQEGKPIRLVGFATGFAGNILNTLQFTYARFIGDDGLIRYMS